MVNLPLYLHFSQTYISEQDKQLQLSPPEGPTSLQYNVLVRHKWHPVIKSMFGLLFRGESVRVEFFGFWPDLRIMMYGIDRSYNSGTFRYVDLAYFRILNAYPVSPAKYKRVNLIKL